MPCTRQRARVPRPLAKVRGTGSKLGRASGPLCGLGTQNGMDTGTLAKTPDVDAEGLQAAAAQGK